MCEGRKRGGDWAKVSTHTCPADEQCSCLFPWVHDEGLGVLSSPPLLRSQRCLLTSWSLEMVMIWGIVVPSLSRGELAGLLGSAYMSASFVYLPSCLMVKCWTLCGWKNQPAWAWSILAISSGPHSRGSSPECPMPQAIGKHLRHRSSHSQLKDSKLLLCCCCFFSPAL